MLAVSKNSCKIQFITQLNEDTYVQDLTLKQLLDKRLMRQRDLALKMKRPEAAISRWANQVYGFRCPGDAFKIGKILKATPVIRLGGYRFVPHKVQRGAKS